MYVNFSLRHSLNSGTNNSTNIRISLLCFVSFVNLGCSLKTLLNFTNFKVMPPLLPPRKKTFSTVNVFIKLSFDKAGKAMLMLLGYEFGYVITEIIMTFVTN